MSAATPSHMPQPQLQPQSQPLSPRPAAADDDALQKEVTLLELVDRLLDKGVVLSGDVTLSVADVDLVYVGLRVLISSVEAAQRLRGGDPPMHEASGDAGGSIR